MNLKQSDFLGASQKIGLSSQQAETLWNELQNCAAPAEKRFDFLNVAYYFGALIVIGSMGWFMNEAWERFGGMGIFFIACAYAICFAGVGITLWKNQNLKTPAGLLVTMAVCMAPLATYGLQRMTGYWNDGDPGMYKDFYIWIKGSWFFMEMATITLGVVAVSFIRFPFLTAPIAFALWFLSMDLTPLYYGSDSFDWYWRQWVSLWFGLIILMIAYAVDWLMEEDFAFWGYLFGMLSFWTGLSLLEHSSEWSMLGYCGINLFLMFLSVVLQRRVFMVFGALGVSYYIGHLADEVFRNSILFPFVLSLQGILIIVLAVWYQRHRVRIDAAIQGIIPESVKILIPKRSFS